jgi:hypothetical protein
VGKNTVLKSIDGDKKAPTDKDGGDGGGFPDPVPVQSAVVVLEVVGLFIDAIEIQNINLTEVRNQIDETISSLVEFVEAYNEATKG